MENGDVLLKDFSIYGKNGDIATGDAKEQIVGINIYSGTGNFRKYPTLGANLYKRLNAPENIQRLANQISNSLELDGWKLLDINFDIEDDNSITATVTNAIKTTDDTQSFI